MNPLRGASSDENDEISPKTVLARGHAPFSDGLLLWTYNYATMIQPVPARGKGTASDVTVFLGGSGTTYDVYIGVALLERGRGFPERCTA